MMFRSSLNYRITSFFFISMAMHLWIIFQLPRMQKVVQAPAVKPQEIVLEFPPPVKPEDVIPPLVQKVRVETLSHTFPSLKEMRKEAAAKASQKNIEEKFSKVGTAPLLALKKEAGEGISSSAGRSDLVKGIVEELAGVMKKQGRAGSFGLNYGLSSSHLPGAIEGHSSVGTSGRYASREEQQIVDGFLKGGPPIYLQGPESEAKMAADKVSSVKNLNRRFGEFVREQSEEQTVSFNGNARNPGVRRSVRRSKPVWDLNGDGAVDDKEYQKAKKAFKAQNEAQMNEELWRLKYSKYFYEDYLELAKKLDNRNQKSQEETPANLGRAVEMDDGNKKSLEYLRSIRNEVPTKTDTIEGWTYAWVESDKLKTLLRLLIDQGDDLGFYGDMLKVLESGEKLRPEVEEIDKMVRFMTGDYSGKMLEKLKRRAESSIPILLEQLRKNDPSVKAGVANILGNFLDNEGVFQSLLELAENPYEIVRRVAVKALGEYGDLRAVPVLQKLANSDSTVAVDYSSVLPGKLQHPEIRTTKQAAQLALFKIYSKNKMDLQIANFAVVLPAGNVKSYRAQKTENAGNSAGFLFKNSEGKTLFRIQNRDTFEEKIGSGKFLGVVRFGSFKKYLRLDGKLKTAKWNYAIPVVRCLNSAGTVVKTVFLAGNVRDFKGNDSWKKFNGIVEMPSDCFEVRVEIFMAGMGEALVDEAQLTWIESAPSGSKIAEAKISAGIGASALDKRDQRLIEFLITSLGVISEGLVEGILRDVIGRDATMNLVYALGDRNPDIVRKAREILTATAAPEELMEIQKMFQRNFRQFEKGDKKETG